MQSFQSILDAVKAFHETFGLDYHETPEVNITDKIIELRHRLMAEENDEYLEAAKDKDITLIADALGDKLYILCALITT